MTHKILGASTLLKEIEFNEEVKTVLVQDRFYSRNV